MEKNDISATCLENLRHIEEHGVDYFVTGNEYVQVGLNLKFIPRVHEDEKIYGGVILFDNNQTLQQSYLIAEHVFSHVKPGTIKFVLIGLSPYVVSANDKDLPVACKVEEKVLENYFKLCLDNGAKPIAFVLSVHSALKNLYDADTMKLFRDTINKVARKYKANFIDLLDAKISDKHFKDKAHLDSDGSSAITALLSAKLYFANIFSVGNILHMDNNYFDVLAKYFPNDYKSLVHHIFCRMACDDFKRLSETLPKEICMDLMARAFSERTYDHLAKLSDMLSKDDYNDLAARIFEISAEKIRRKDKIKVGFFAHNSSMWFGDDLYNLLANDERFEPTLFLNTKSVNKVMSEEFSCDAEKFKAHGINVFDLSDKTLTIPAQDVFFCLVPYTNSPPVPFRLVNLHLTTLLASFSYSLSVADRGGMLNLAFYRVLWKMFASSPVQFEILRTKNKVFSASRMFYSGYPKQDIFFKPNSKFHFDWKMARPDAKKIIWAPHHSIVNNGPLLATFQWNYEFMYEFAKAHPETSWIIKAHAHLPEKVIKSKLFPNIKSYEKYLQAWNDLPNAQVYMGAYYQAIFATSDGMIQDSGSFIAEYQYVDKPMIYLTRDTQRFNELGNEILKASYTVDGKDLDAIAAMMQRVFIEGDDYKAAERRAVFDKYLNYPKANGMLASEFIYHSIADELKEASK